MPSASKSRAVLSRSQSSSVAGERSSPANSVLGTAQITSPEVNRALYVRNLPFKITAEEMYDIFGKFGALRQVRLGNAQDTRGTAFVVYEDIYDAKTAVDHLSGFNVCGRCACKTGSILPGLFLFFLHTLQALC